MHLLAQRFTLLTGCLGLALAGCGPPDDTPLRKPKPTTLDSTPVTVTTPPLPRAVVLMIGDGMGFGHVEAGAWFAHGAPTGLTMQQLDASGSIRTANLDGITDSAASGTVMACGTHTWDGQIGMNRHRLPAENLVELAHSLDFATGVVTTSRIPHATPAVFTAHHTDRDDELRIAELQISSPIDLLLGGGWGYFYESTHPQSNRKDDGLLDEVAAAGITWVDTADELAAATLPIFGAFSKEHLIYEANRGPATTSPDLVDLTQTALDRLEADPEGFFLMIEGSRIDHAGHGNDIDLMLPEVVAFDRALETVLAWEALGTHELTVIVTADHECGGLEVLSGGAAGTAPQVDWRWGNHTNADIPVFASGPGTEVFDGELLDQAWVYAVLHSRITDTPAVAPDRWLLPDGRFDDLDHRPTTQVNPSSLGDDLARLNALQIDADADGLAIGVEGLFPWATHTLAIAIDADFGAATGHAALAGAINDIDMPVDLAVSNLPLLAPPVAGFGADMVLVSAGGAETPYLRAFRGLRGLDGPWGSPTELGELKVGINYGMNVRTLPKAPAQLVPGEGAEFYIPWIAVWPDLQGGVPPGTTIALSAVLTNLAGDDLSNQVLPPFPPGTAAPGVVPTPIPGLVIFELDADGDGVASDATAPYVLP